MPGIGFMYVENKNEYHSRDLSLNRVYMGKGEFKPMPKYYQQKLYTPDQRQAVGELKYKDALKREAVIYQDAKQYGYTDPEMYDLAQQAKCITAIKYKLSKKK